MTGNEKREQLTYYYKEKVRKAEITVVTRPPRVTFWFRFPRSRPVMFSKVNSIWLYNNCKPLIDDIERADLWRALTEAIDQQLASKYLQDKKMNAILSTINHTTLEALGFKKLNSLTTSDPKSPFLPHSDYFQLNEVDVLLHDDGNVTTLKNGKYSEMTLEQLKAYSQSLRGE